MAHRWRLQYDIQDKGKTGRMRQAGSGGGSLQQLHPQQLVNRHANSQWYTYLEQPTDWEIPYSFKTRQISHLG